jgi:beta-phosphoglucomutase
MLQAIIFDFDGVIADSEFIHYKAFLAIAQELGITFDYEEYLETYVGFSDRDAFRIMVGAVPGKPGTPAQEAKVKTLVELKAAAFEKIVAQGIQPVPGTIDLIHAANSEGLPIAIASGATRQDIQIVLQKLGIATLISIIVSADDVEQSKPHPASYTLAFQKLSQKHPAKNLTPENTLAIEDTHAGLTSAKKAGFMTLGVATTGPASLLGIANRVIPNPSHVTLDTLRQWY